MPPPAAETGPSLTYPKATKLLNRFATFLALALHTLLYHRSLYPEVTFLTARAYDLPVHQSRHPGVCLWVSDAVTAVVAQLRTAAVERVVFVVHEKGFVTKATAPSTTVASKTAPKIAPKAAAKTGPNTAPKVAIKAAPKAPPMAPPMAPPKAAPIATPMGPPPPKSLPPKTLAPTTAFAVKGATNNNEVKKDSKGGQKTFNVVERWIFDVSSFPMWPDDDDDDDDDGDNAENNNAETVKNNGPEGGDQEMNEADDEEVRVVVNEDSEDSEGDDDDDDDDDEEDEDAINWDDINESLRGALGRLASAAEEMPRLPEGCPFTLAIELRGEASPPIAHSRLWIPSQRLPRRLKKKLRRRARKQTRTTKPVRSVHAGPLFFECWVEQSHEAKEDKRETLQLSRKSRNTKTAPS